MPTAITRATLDKLARFDTPTICNVIELFDCRPYNRGYMDTRIRADMSTMKPMVGFASTATFRADAPPDADSAYGSLADQLDDFPNLPGPPVMVFQDLDDPPVAATFGEVMCSTYQAFGAVGLVTSGGSRDLEQVAALGFPTFSSGPICAHAYCHFTSLREPVRVGGVVIRHGDLLHGDVNGVTTIPLELANDIADLCQPFVDAEEHVMQYVKAGDVTVAGFRENLDMTKAAFAALREKARGCIAQ